jgi:glutamine cyclotransferase
MRCWIVRFIIIFAAVSSYLVICCLLVSCQRSVDSPLPRENPKIPIYSYQIINEFPHLQDAFTQGLVYLDGFIYESTGLYGHSSLRKLDLLSGQIQQSINIDNQYFAEGITIFQNKIFQLTWQSNTAFVYDKDTFELIEQFSYPGEGWGITNDGISLIMSDGTAFLRYLDPLTFQELKKIEVTDSGAAISRLNELEFVEGEIFANVWLTDLIAKISPSTGEVVGWIDLGDLLLSGDCLHPIDVLNGIAYDPAGKRLFVTGKFWCKLFEIQLIEK